MRRIRDQYRLVILNEETLEERISFKLSRLNVFVAIGLLSIILVFITTYIIAFTPLKEYIPGYTNMKLNKESYVNALKIDSLQNEVKSRELYLTNLKMIFNGKAIIDDFATMISKKAVNSFVRTEFKSIKDDLFLKELVDSLTLNGISMEIAGDSSPASGSEHLISHALDKIVEIPQLHGIQVGIATYIMSKVQNHRFERISKILTTTGFFDYVKTLKMKKEDFIKAVDIAPSIKPNRYTYIHVEENRMLAKKFINEDETLNSILN